MDEELAAFALLLPAAWSVRTARCWRADNPALGQCSVTALVVQDRFGGSLLKTRVGSAWHFYNRLGAARCDLTAGQFAVAPAYEDLPASREEAFGDTTPEQHAELRRALGL